MENLRGHALGIFRQVGQAEDPKCRRGSLTTSRCALRLLYGKQIVHGGPTFNHSWLLIFASGDTLVSLGQLDTLHGTSGVPRSTRVVLIEAPLGTVRVSAIGESDEHYRNQIVLLSVVL
jgi:hypothetical protein